MSEAASGIKVSQKFRKLIPPLQEWELALLEESICRDGCRDRLVLWKEKGTLLDGHNRITICNRHGIEYKTTALSFPDEDAAKLWVIKNQVGRRNLSETQRSICAAEMANLERGDNQHSSIEGTSIKAAAEAFKVGHASVERAKKVLADGCAELQAAVREDKLPVSVAAEIAELDEERQKKLAADPEKATEFAKLNREKKTALRQKRDAERARKKAAAVAEDHPLSGESFKLHVGEFSAVAKKEIRDGSIDAIITDPPYSEKFVPEFQRLANVAARVLRPGGHLLVMAGQSHLPQVLRALTAADGVKYQWCLAYLTPGQSAQVFGRKIKSNWKPVVWMIKGACDSEHVEDTVRSDENDKRFHEWGQSVGGIAQLVARFTVEKSLIFDPFLGGGSTAVAAIQTGRLFVGCDVDAGCVAETAKRLSPNDSGEA